MAAEQFEMPLPRRSPEDLLREKLEIAVGEFNAALDPRDRCKWFVEVRDLRRRIAAGGAK